MEQKIVIDVRTLLQHLNIHNVSCDLFLSKPHDQTQKTPVNGSALCSMLVEQALQELPVKVV
ncbi:hypothetical protein [Paenibacillus sp.]|uniref:hypothetical protein n=1 Tax=Paenibacillus sp. TaxID=58172 RepID=UPI002D65BA8E|nr:hypothetical protein [Paenibacillus sp.]HZG83808.1 hypothetical protein [Paenibacillus sp.]